MGVLRLGQAKVTRLALAHCMGHIEVRMLDSQQQETCASSNSEGMVMFEPQIPRSLVADFYVEEDLMSSKQLVREWLQKEAKKRRCQAPRHQP